MIGTVMQSPDWGGEDGGETYIAFRMICPIDDLRRGSWGRRRLRQVGRDVGRRSFCHRGELLRATRYRIFVSGISRAKILFDPRIKPN